nr:hypothetical protein [uncultured bacterium]
MHCFLKGKQRHRSLQRPSFIYKIPSGINYVSTFPGRKFKNCFQRSWFQSIIGV